MFILVTNSFTGLFPDASGPSMKHDLLHEALIQTDIGMFSLPGLLTAMAAGRVSSFPALRPHQRPAWHMFLVQLGVMAIARAGLDTLPQDDAGWRAALRGLTADFPDDAPWHLVVDAAAQPGFLQPPDPGGLKWTEVATPDALDMVITSRNHDLKSEVAQNAAPQDWIFALVSLQTMEGFGGAGHYGIFRMNGGSSSRAMLALAPAGQGGRVVDPSAWFRRDVLRLLPGAERTEKPALLWCLPWSEGRALTLDQLDPLVIEICRRVRLRDGLTALRATSGSARVDAKELKGMTDDPWAPTHVAETKALTLGERDWTYKLICELCLSGTWKPPLLAQPGPDEAAADMLLIAEAFARGNSKTDGFKSRVIPVPKAVRRTMQGQEAIDLAQDQIELIKKVDTALRNGLALISAGGEWDKLGKPHYARSLPARDALQARADALFFPALWDKLAAGSRDGRNAVHARLMRDLAAGARAEFDRAAPAIPCAAIMRPRAETRGRAAMNRSIAAIFKESDMTEVEHA